MTTRTLVQGRVARFRGWTLPLFLTSFLFVVFPLPFAAAMVLKLSIQSPGDCVIPDPIDHVLRRSTDGSPREIFLSQDPNASPARAYFIPEDGASPQAVVLKFRLEEIALEEQRHLPPTGADFFASGAGLADTRSTITDYKWGTGEGDFVEFTFTLERVYLSWGVIQFYRIQPSYGVFTTVWYANLSLTFAAPFEILDTEREGAEVDRWFVLVSKVFPPTYVDGGPLPDFISLEDAPLAGETVSIFGEKLIFEPDHATTDDQGVFGVLAFVDPAEFEPDSKSPKGAIRDPVDRDKADKTGTLTLAYKNHIRKRGIKGNYCEVIRVEGVVQIVHGTGGSVKVGDILVPGTRLSLSTGYGKEALLGLRFINGSDAELIQDLYTNACITDLIEIGSTGISNLSVIQGKTALAAVSRYLCEQIAGFPDSPEEWAEAAGKFTVKAAASAAVPGSGITAFAVRYLVQTEAGKVYDQVMTSPGDQGEKRAFAKQPLPAGDERAEISWYYDGSTRVTTNIVGGVTLFSATETTPFALILPNQWQEIQDSNTLGRVWSENPDSMDHAGPVFRMGIELYPEAWISQIDLHAFDTSGLDEDSLVVRIQNAAIDGFERQGPGWWSASFFGPPLALQDLEFSLSDRLGNETVQVWSFSGVPSAPILTNARPGTYPGGFTILDWESGLSEEELLLFEIRQIWQTVQGLRYGPWQSVGPIFRAVLELPAGVDLTLPYSIEIRAFTQTGIGGLTARTVEMYPKAPSGFSGWLLR